jgi:transcriptional regulator GlxA family with amidase domain
LDEEPVFGLGSVADPDAIARSAERDPIAAVRILKAELQRLEPPLTDWPDLLARDLLDDPQVRLEHWADRHDLAPESVSRGFKRVFSASPAEFRAEVRAQRALALIVSGTTALAAVAAATGFADQAHMTRGIAALTGRPPGWLRSNWFKTRRAVRSYMEA